MFPDFLNLDSDQVAKKLLGCYLVRQTSSGEAIVKIVETESYDQDDMASHTYNGKTPRNEVMFGPSGRLYVYFTYGMHYCCNVVTGRPGEGSAVLIRAVEPIQGHEILESHRPRGGKDLTNGPAKLCQALDIDRRLNGHDLHETPLVLTTGEQVPEASIVQTSRIGIKKAVDEPRRYYLKDNHFVSGF